MPLNYAGPVTGITTRERGIFMNAFKKELAGMLLDESQLLRSTGQIIRDMDYIFKNHSMQIEHPETMIVWDMFLWDLMHSFMADVQERCILESQEIDEETKNILDLVILLNRYFDTDDSVQDMVLENTNESFVEYYEKRKKELLK